MPLEVNPQQLRALRAVLDTGSFTAASEQLGYTQSALSKQISALETATGVKLFVRGPRGVQPTDAAQRFSRRAIAVLDHLDAAERELSDISDVGGRAALGAFPTAAMELAPRAIARVHGEHPSVEVAFAESSTPVLIRRLRAGRLDLAIIASGEGLPDWDLTGIETERLPSATLRVAVSRQHRFAHLSSVSVSDLADEAWIAGNGARGEPQFGPWPSLAEPRIFAVFDHWTTRLGFVAAGLGITTIPSLAIGALPSDVVAVAVDDTNPTERTLLLAHIGALSATAATVRLAVARTAADLATEYR